MLALGVWALGVALGVGFVVVFALVRAVALPEVLLPLTGAGRVPTLEEARGRGLRGEGTDAGLLTGLDIESQRAMRLSGKPYKRLRVYGAFKHHSRQLNERWFIALPVVLLMPVLLGVVHERAGVPSQWFWLWSRKRHFPARVIRLDCNCTHGMLT